MPRRRRTVAILAGIALGCVRGIAPAGITADVVIGYTPGNLAENADTAWENASAALGPLSGDTLQGFGALNPFNPAFDTSQIVGIGAGGELTLHLSAAVAVASSPTLGVYSNNGLADVSADGSGLASNPATTLDDPDHPSAIVSVSSDGVHFVALNGGNAITFSNPTNYYTDQPIVSDYEAPGVATADPFQPFTGSLASFNGENFSQIKATLNGSAGGNWLILSGTGLSSVSYARFDVPTADDFPMFVDSVAGVSQQANDLWNNSGGSGDGFTWDTIQPNWNNGSPAVTYNDYTYPSAIGDNVIFNDSNAGHYNVSIPSLVHPASVLVNNSASTYTFNGSGGIGGNASLTKTGTASLILATTNSYTGITNVSGGTLILAVAGALPAGTNLNIAAGAAMLAQSTSATFNVSSLSIAGAANHWTGKLDLGSNDFVVQGGDLAMLTNQLGQGYNSGKWNGSGGITSRAAAADLAHLHALGIVQNGDDVNIAYTYYGDANLDGIVDGSDYSVIDSSYLREVTSPVHQAVSGWSNGDFNYDGVVDGSDYTLIDNAFNSQDAQITAVLAIPTSQIAVDASPVPEPTGLIGGAAATVLGRRRNRRQAFTLVELLVVICIVTVLVGLLLPALSRAREQAKTAQCLSNLHQLGLAAYIYAVDSHGSWPPAIGPTNVDWDFDYSNPSRGILPGILWNGKTNMRVQQCPSFDGKSLGTTDPFTGYNYNTSYVAGGNGEVTPLGNPHSPAKIGMLRPPATIAMFGDAMSAGGTNKFMRAPILMFNTDIGDGVSVSTRLAGTQGYRHLGKTNVCYLDGHAASVSACFTTAAKNVNGTLLYGSIGAAPGTGFLSADNSAYAGQ